MMVAQDIDQEILELTQKLPTLSDKVILDMVNGIEVSRDHIRVRANRGGFFQRAWDALTGKSHRRQQQIDQSLTEGLAAVSNYVQNLALHQVQSDRAMIRIAEILYETREGIIELVDSHKKLQHSVGILEHALADLKRKHQVLEEEVNRLGLRQSAAIHMNRVFDRWAAGAFDEYPPLIQLMLALDELYWSPFSRYDATNPEFRNQVVDKVIIQLNRVTGRGPTELYTTRQWLGSLDKVGNVKRDAFAYLLNPGKSNRELLPITTVTVGLLEQPAGVDVEHWLHQNGVTTLPHVLANKLLSQRMVTETVLRMLGDVA